MNVYSDILKRNIPRLLNTINLDSFSDAYGNADREYWGWKIKDFTNGTNLGAIHALTIAYRLGIYDDKSQLLTIVDAVFRSIKDTASNKGSFVEAYPNEHSFCVTALVAFDALSALKFLDGEINDEEKQKYLSNIRPLISFISRYDEQHAIISNHLATAVAAITLWNKLTAEKNKRDQELLDIIYKHQSEEGWYKEYEGADPGYQTLCTYYLAAAWEVNQDEKLRKSIFSSLEFLKYFAQPDHSIGGLYGSRNTEVYYPAGIVRMSADDKNAALLADHLEKGIGLNRHIMPESVDIGNFTPLLNAYARAAWYVEKYGAQSADEKLPYSDEFEKEFPETGIYLKATPRYYAISNYKKGGVMKVFDLNTAQLDFEYSGIFADLNNGVKASTQLFNENATFTDHAIKTELYKLNEDYPTPFRFLIIRMLSLCIFRNVGLGIRFKKMIVKRLMTGKKKAGAKASIKINFSADKVTITEKVVSKQKIKVDHPPRSRAVHMASSGYNSAASFIKAEEAQLVEIITDINKP